VTPHSGAGTTCRSTPSTVLDNFLKAAWYAAHNFALQAM
jgi:hypothetical protein